MPGGTCELHPVDALYPDAVLELSDVPQTLFVRGDPEVLSTPALSIIGARTASPYGLAVAELAAKVAVEAGVTVVSGGAVGCAQASGWAAVNKIVVLSLNVVGNRIFSPRGGMVAAAVVWAVCRVLDAAMATVQVSRFIGGTPKLSEVVKPILVVGASAVIPGGCIAWICGRDSFVGTVLGSALSLLVFACVCWLLRAHLDLSGLGSLAKKKRG